MSTRGQMPEGSGVKRCIRPVAVSVLIGAVCCTVILVLLSLVLASANIPQFAVDPMASFALAAGGLVAGFCCTKIMGENGLAYGALTGAVMTLVVLLAGLALKDNSFGVPALLKIAYVMLSSMLGGVVGVNTKKRRK